MTRKHEKEITQIRGQYEKVIELLGSRDENSYYGGGSGMEGQSSYWKSGVVVGEGDGYKRDEKCT